MGKNPSQQLLGTTVSKFASGQAAQGAMADLIARCGPWLLYDHRRINWPGQDPSTHWMFQGIATKEYVAVQLVGQYLVSAAAPDRTLAVSTLPTLVTNLRAAGMVP